MSKPDIITSNTHRLSSKQIFMTVRSVLYGKVDPCSGLLSTVLGVFHLWVDSSAPAAKSLFSVGRSCYERNGII